jgi:hypothetical protein
MGDPFDRFEFWGHLSDNRNGFHYRYRPNAFSDQNDAVAWPQLAAVDQMIESEKLVSGDGVTNREPQIQQAGGPRRGRQDPSLS